MLRKKSFIKRLINYFERKGYTNILSDKQYLKLMHWTIMDRKLDLRNPRSFNEKLQWLKLYNRKDIYTTLVDKYDVKKYIASIIGEACVIPSLGVWRKFEDINFDLLPNHFVLKCTHDSGRAIVCVDKNKLDKDKIREKINKSLNRNYYWFGREWPYKNVEPRVMAEVYMEDENDSKGLRDYKFFCFNNEPKFLYVSEGLEDHATAKISFFDFNGKRLPFGRSDYRPMPAEIELPETMSKMKDMAKLIAEKIDSPFVRVDLYSIKGQIYFSEITFFPCSGHMPFEPESWDEKLGDWISLE